MVSIVDYDEIDNVVILDPKAHNLINSYMRKSTKKEVQAVVDILFYLYDVRSPLINLLPTDKMEKLETMQPLAPKILKAYPDVINELAALVESPSNKLARQMLERVSELMTYYSTTPITEGSFKDKVRDAKELATLVKLQRELEQAIAAERTANIVGKKKKSLSAFESMSIRKT
jgi:hypothetical protein